MRTDHDAEIMTATFRRWGPRFALIGVLLAATVAWSTGSLWGTSDYYGRGYKWVEAGLVYIPLALLAMGAGLLVSGWPELRRRGAAARRFLAAERRNLAAGKRVVGRMFWGLILTAGVLSTLLLAASGAVWWRGPPGGLIENVVVISICATFGFSILIPVMVAAAAAVNLSSSRRSGAAENLLVAPLTADNLGWAGSEIQSRRGLWMLATAAPFYWVPVLILVTEFRHQAGDAIFAGMIVVLALTLFSELFMIRRSAALGAWLGAALPVPALAAALAAVGSVLFWLVRLAFIGLAFSVAHDFFRGSTLRFWYWPPAALAADVLFLGLSAPFFLWLARGSLRAPLGLRLGGWMVRTGNRLSGLGDVEGDGAIAGRRTVTLARPRPRRELGWKTNTFGVWVFAVLAWFAFPVGGAIAHEYQGEGMGELFVGAIIAVLLCLAAVSRLLLRFIVRRVRTAGGEDAKRR